MREKNSTLHICLPVVWLVFFSFVFCLFFFCFSFLFVFFFFHVTLLKARKINIFKTNIYFTNHLHPIRVRKSFQLKTTSYFKSFVIFSIFFFLIFFNFFSYNNIAFQCNHEYELLSFY